MALSRQVFLMTMVTAVGCIFEWKKGPKSNHRVNPSELIVPSYS